MKMKKIVALLLALAMIVGVVAACDDTTDGDDDGDDATETTAPEDDDDDGDDVDDDDDDDVDEPAGPPANVIPPADVSDEGDGDPIVWSWNDEFQGLLDNYYVEDNPDFAYTYEMTEETQYSGRLETVLASGDGAPDIYLLEAGYVLAFLGDGSLNVNELGIDYAELADQYPYTYELTMAPNGAIKALSWQSNPAGVFYNRTLAEEYLGSSEAEDVAPYFATWDAFMETCEMVAEESDGTVKAISGTDEIRRSFQNTREDSWVVDGEVVVDENMKTYLQFAKDLQDNDLTFEAGQWSDTWTANMSNETVLSYWGPMWLLMYCMGFGFDDDGNVAEGANPTSGDWGLVPSPDPWFWGGTWIAASNVCQYKATAADIMRYFTTESDSMMKMALDGQFVNSVPIMEELGADPEFGSPYLGGDNVIPVLLEIANEIDVSTMSAEDHAIDSLFEAITQQYVDGELETIAEAEQAFIDMVVDAGYA